MKEEVDALDWRRLTQKIETEEKMVNLLLPVFCSLRLFHLLFPFLSAA